MRSASVKLYKMKRDIQSAQGQKVHFLADVFVVSVFFFLTQKLQNRKAKHFAITLLQEETDYTVTHPSIFFFFGSLSCRPVRVTRLTCGGLKLVLFFCFFSGCHRHLLEAARPCPAGNSEFRTNPNVSFVFQLLPLLELLPMSKLKNTIFNCVFCPARVSVIARHPQPAAITCPARRLHSFDKQRRGFQRQFKQEIFRFAWWTLRMKCMAAICRCQRDEARRLKTKEAKWSALSATIFKVCVSSQMLLWAERHKTMSLSAATVATANVFVSGHSFHIISGRRVCFAVLKLGSFRSLSLLWRWPIMYHLIQCSSLAHSSGATLIKNKNHSKALTKHLHKPEIIKY